MKTTLAILLTILAYIAADASKVNECFRFCQGIPTVEETGQPPQPDPVNTPQKKVESLYWETLEALKQSQEQLL